MLCLPKPLEIGNRVWLDANKNGVQDAGETPIAGVLLELVNSQGQVVGQATTDALGSYIFNQSNVIDAPGPNQTLKPGVRVFADYTIRVATTQFNGIGAGVLANLIPTSTTVDTGEGSSERDNNASRLGTTVGFSYKTGQSGESDHTLDIGFKAGQPLLELTKVVSETQVPMGSPLSYTVQLSNTGTASGSALEVQDQLDEGLIFVSATPSLGTFVDNSTGGTWTIPELAPGQTASLTVQARANAVGTLRNQATFDTQTAIVTTIVYCPTGVCLPITVQRVR